MKIVAADRQAALAFIPGVAYAADGSGQAFIQVLDGMGCSAHFHAFPVAAFRPAPDKFAVTIGDNYFGADRLRLQLPGMTGEVSWTNTVDWPTTWGAPGVMGWYAFVPFMECYHGVVSMDHDLQGTLRHNDRTIDFTGGKGYIEKDWGRSFPSSWIWLQSNNFPAHPGTSLMVSVARIPWLGSHFVGFLCGLWHQGKLYRMTTYSGAKLDVALSDKQAHLTIRQRNWLLTVTGTPGPGGDLLSPLNGQMTGKINESLQGQLHVTFHVDDQLLFADTGHPAGLEVSERAAVELV